MGRTALRRATVVLTALFVQGTILLRRSLLLTARPSLRPLRDREGARWVAFLCISSNRARMERHSC